ncbi:MAG: hypothetical protein B7Z66_15850 [Chromatiales bacterium 21-64-14]|nr:MAG: hypothetical protein B7Z66_15850 [Chromatiales bacterium 21-64-14]
MALAIFLAEVLRADGARPNVVYEAIVKQRAARGTCGQCGRRGYCMAARHRLLVEMACERAC